MLARWLKTHERSVLFLFVVLIAAGIWTAVGLPVSLFPAVKFPRVVVALESGDRSAERMAVEVTWKAEERLRALPGVRSVRSTTSRGSAEISVNFDWGEDMTSALLQTQAAMAQALPGLPTGTTFAVRRMDPTVFPVLAYSLVSSSRSPMDLRNLAQYELRPLLSSVEGVARVEVLGGAREEFQVIVDPVRLAAQGLTLDDVSVAIGAANSVMAVGRLEENFKLFLVLGQSSLISLEDVGHTVLKSGKDGLVQLDDVATVLRGAAPQWTRVTAAGRDAVIFQVYQQPGSNTVRLAAETAAELEAYRKKLPPDVQLARWYDQSTLIVESAAGVRDAVIVGALLAAAVLLLFLRSLKLTLVAALAVPSVLACSAIVLWAFGMSFNIMTLGGMAAAVGLIIDDTIVMAEHLVRRARERAGEDPGVLASASEFTGPLAGSSLASLVIFLPLVFLGGVTGAFFKALSLTMGVSVVFSFLLAWLAVPLIARRLLTAADAQREESGWVTRLAHRAYARAMGGVVNRPVWLVLGIVPIVLAGIFFFNRLGSGFMPAMDEGGFILDYRSAPGTSLSETDRLLKQVEEILKQTHEVETYSRRTGLALGGGLTEANEGDFFVSLVGAPRRPVEQVMDEVRGRIHREVPGLSIEMAQLMEDLIGDLTAVPQPIEVKLFSEDGAALEKLAPKVAALIATVPGVVDVRSGVVPAGDSILVKVDPVKAALEGTDARRVNAALSQLLAGVIATTVVSSPRAIDIRVWTASDLRSRKTQIERLMLKASDGHLFALRRVATVVVEAGLPRLQRENLRRLVAVTGRISGRDLGSTVADVERALKASQLVPSSVSWRLGGVYAEQQAAFSGLVLVFCSALVLVFIVLLFLYESFRVASSVLMTTLTVVAGVFCGLWLTATELNISAMMGLTMVIGFVTEVAIFYVSELRLLHDEAWPDRLVIAGKSRLRPIAMTTLAAILALLPLALGLGQGASMQRPLAIAIVCGLVLQLPAVLVLLPALLSLLRAKPDGSLE